MKQRRRRSYSNIHESFSDVALLMLATFIFLLVTILITSRMKDSMEEHSAQSSAQELAELRAEVAALEQENDSLNGDIDEMAGMGLAEQMEEVLEAVGLNSARGRRDFDLFIKGLKDLPGKTIHLVIDTTGSMHGAATFIIPMLRVIVVRSGKELAAITWFSDSRAETYQGTMGEMFDAFMDGAPFLGNHETIGDAFIQAAKNAPAPGAYILFGDEPSDDRIFYLNIPSPVFTIPLGHNNTFTKHEYRSLAEKTGGKMLQLELKQ